MKIYTYEDRKKEPVYSKMLIAGFPGAGKTHLLYTLDPKKTVFIDLEAGDLTVKDWTGDYTLRPKTWQEMRDIAVFFGGPNPNAVEKLKYITEEEIPYSQEHYDRVVKDFGEIGAKMKEDCETLFIDSMSDASKLCKRYTDAHPTSITKNGEFNGIGSYGMTKEELYNIVDTFQKTREKNIIMLAQIGQKEDEYGKTHAYVDVEGSFKTTFPHMPDHVFYLEEVHDEDSSWRQIVTSGLKLKAKGLKLKTRVSGVLSEIERPDLGYLINKIKENKKIKEPKTEKKEEENGSK